MTALIARLILLAAPVVLLIVWLRYRTAHNRQDADLNREIIRGRRILLAALIAMFAAVLMLYFDKDDRGHAHTRYVPPHIEDGRLVPGRFVPVEPAVPDGEPNDGPISPPDEEEPPADNDPPGF